MVVVAVVRQALMETVQQVAMVLSGDRMVAVEVEVVVVLWVISTPPT